MTSNAQPKLSGLHHRPCIAGSMMFMPASRHTGCAVAHPHDAGTAFDVVENAPDGYVKMFKP